MPLEALARGMNRLLAALKKNDQLSVEALRSLYRSLRSPTTTKPAR